MIVHPSESREELEKLERKHAENPEGRYFVPLANAYRKVGELDQAIDVLREGLEKHRDYLSAHIVLGRCLADKGDAEAAEAEFRYVLTLDPQNLIALRTLGEISLADGKIEDAERWYRELLTVDPMNEDARRALDGIQVIPSAAAASEHSAGTGNAFGASAVPGWEDRPQQPTRPPPTSQPDDAAVDLDSAYGRVVQLDQGGDREGDGQQFGAEGQAVVTETIAELYTRQGFYSRAADVYRELIRRKGPTRELEERLHRVEELAAGQATEQPIQRREAARPPSPPRPEPGEEWVLESAASYAAEPERATRDATPQPVEDLPFEQEPEAHEPETLAQPRAESLIDEMGSFVGSFLDGFADIDRTAEPADVSPSEPEMPRPEPAGFEPPVELERWMGEEEDSTSPLHGSADPDLDQESIRDYLGSVLSWRPAAPAESEATTSAAYVWSPPEPASPRPVDDADLFPWELPEQTAEPEATDVPQPTSGPASLEEYGVRELTRASDSPTWGDLLAAPERTSGSEPVEKGSESEPSAARQSFRSEPTPQAEPKPQPPRAESAAPPSQAASEPPQAPAPAQAQPAEPGTPATEEDDLESFQAWLRSLKR